MCVFLVMKSSFISMNLCVCDSPFTQKWLFVVYLASIICLSLSFCCLICHPQLALCPLYYLIWSVVLFCCGCCHFQSAKWSFSRWYPYVKLCCVSEDPMYSCVVKTPVCIYSCVVKTYMYSCVVKTPMYSYVVKTPALSLQYTDGDMGEGIWLRDALYHYWCCHHSQIHAEVNQCYNCIVW